MKTKALFILALLCATVSSAMAETVIVINESELNAAIVEGNVIKLGTDIRLNSCLIINKKVTIDLNGWDLGRGLSAPPANGGDGHVIGIRAGGSLTINDGSYEKTGTISGGYAANGGGIYINSGASLIINSGTITSNYSTTCGGGIYNNGTLIFNGGTIKDNSGGDCGGIFNDDNGSLTIEGGTISGNSSNVGGGGIVNRGEASILNCTISGNHATTRGGGIWNCGNLFVSNSVVIENNRADIEGGGIQSAYRVNKVCNVTINGSTIRNNYSVDGGGICVEENTTVSIDDITVTGNTCVNSGGAIWSKGTVKVKGHVNLTGNHKANGWDSNFFVTNGHVININGSIAGTIGVSHENNSGVVTSGLSGHGSIDNFTNDYSAVSDLALVDGEAKLTAKSGVYYIERGWDAKNRRVTETLRFLNAGQYTELTGDNVSEKVTLISNGWYVVKAAAVARQFLIAPEGAAANLILCDGAKLYSTILIEVGHSLNIYGQTNNTGVLEAKSKETTGYMGGNKKLYCPIGGYFGNESSDMGTLTVHGGTINADGRADNKFTPAIGSNHFGKGGTVNIYGGSVNAIGGDAGIGGGFQHSGGTTNIYGGTVYAKGGGYGAGIGAGGAGDGVHGGTTNIYGGNVEAHGGEWAAGIGGGKNGSGGNITISGGTVKAYGGDDAAGIGSGEEAVRGNSIDGGTIIITGGFVEAWGNDQGAGIGAGEDAGMGNIIISGGTVIAHGGENSNGICSDDTADGANSLVIGNNMRLRVSENIYPASYRNNIQSFHDIQIEPCSHESVTYTVTDKTHTKNCNYCLYSLTEPHHYVDGVCTACGKEFHPDVLLTDLADNSHILNQAVGKTVSVSIRNRTLDADYSKGTWHSRAYTVCLPFDLDIYKQTGNNSDVQYYQLYAISNNREYIFQEARYKDVEDVSQAPNILYAGQPYVVVVHRGELRLEAEDVTICTKPVDIPVVQALEEGSSPAEDYSKEQKVSLERSDTSRLMQEKRNVSAA